MSFESAFQPSSSSSIIPVPEYFNRAHNSAIGAFSNFSAVHGNQNNYYNQEQKRVTRYIVGTQEEEAEYEQFPEVLRSQFIAFRNICSRPIYRKEHYKWMECGRRTVVAGELVIGGGVSKCLTVLYSGERAEEAWKEDFRQFGGIRRSENAQLAAINLSSIPMLVLTGDLVPLAHLKDRVGIIGEGYLRALARQMDCYVGDTLWMDTSRGVFCRGPRGPYCYIKGYFDFEKKLSLDAELLKEDVMARYLGSIKQNRKVIDGLFSDSQANASQTEVNRPTVMSTLTNTILALGRGVWKEGKESCLGEREELANGATSTDTAQVSICGQVVMNQYVTGLYRPQVSFMPTEFLWRVTWTYMAGYHIQNLNNKDVGHLHPSTSSSLPSPHPPSGLLIQMVRMPSPPTAAMTLVFLSALSWNATRHILGQLPPTKLCKPIRLLKALTPKQLTSLDVMDTASTRSQISLFQLAILKKFPNLSLRESELVLPEKLLGNLPDSEAQQQRREESPPIYLFIPPLSTSTFWSFDPDGQNTDLCHHLGLPISLWMKCWQYSWSAATYKAMQTYQIAQGFNPNTNEFARHNRYRIYKTAEQTLPSRFEELEDSEPTEISRLPYTWKIYLQELHLVTSSPTIPRRMPPHTAAVSFKKVLDILPTVSIKTNEAHPIWISQISRASTLPKLAAPFHKDVPPSENNIRVHAKDLATVPPTNEHTILLPSQHPPTDIILSVSSLDVQSILRQEKTTNEFVCKQSIGPPLSVARVWFYVTAPEFSLIVYICEVGTMMTADVKTKGKGLKSAPREGTILPVPTSMLEAIPWHMQQLVWSLRSETPTPAAGAGGEKARMKRKASEVTDADGDEDIEVTRMGKRVRRSPGVASRNSSLAAVSMMNPPCDAMDID
ncbi:hypothetical protein V5O48_011985 [Marasmius crinis-equi]|uniref:Uncharacterized protein n=1 Tax=Marasmius crinis-equi TaxID=585013 RepID=A0ABR3F407_9AGAR